MGKSKLLFRVHAVQRMFERKITLKSVAQTIQSGETIEDYSPEMAAPGRLILGFQGKRSLHVVTSEDQKMNEIVIVTVYLPHPDKWNKNFTSRRS